MDGVPDFFDEVREQSRIKTRIVSKYFWAWAKVITSVMKGSADRIGYVDLFAGPGKYEDGTPSTPLIVLKAVISDPRLRNMLVTVFNDKTPDFARSLQENIDAIPGVGTLKYKPVVKNQEVGQRIIDHFQSSRLIPTFLFVDPWGYKGLSIELISSVLRNWGCDCVFFFNYNRINAGLNNEVVREHMNDLFGEQKADAIRRRVAGLPPDEREAVIIEELSSALKEQGINYVLPFTFKTEHGTRTTHHLIFASKHFRGYEIMKEIMAKESSDQEQGIASFGYYLASEKYQQLFEFSRPLSHLEEMLLSEFAGQTLSMYKIYEHHNIGRNYIKINYKKALTKLEADGRIRTKPQATERPKRNGEVTFADEVVVTFPGGPINESSVSN
jgi:three-Cys-motif partner protein